jgi:hypothetical protein
MGEMNFTPLVWWLAPLGSILALVFAWVYYKQVMAADEGSPKMKEIAGYVKQGAMAYLVKAVQDSGKGIYRAGNNPDHTGIPWCGRIPLCLSHS